MLRIVLFDLGGLLIELTGIDTFRVWTGGRLTVEDIWARWLTSPAVRAFETGRITPEEFGDRLIEEFGLPVSRDELLEAFAAWPRGLYPGARNLLQRLDRRYTRAMLSNSNVLHWPRVMSEFGLGGLFDHHFASHLLGKLKPDREVFEHVVAELRCGAGEILFLDDQPLNVRAAQETGMQAVVATSVEQATQILASRGMLGPNP